MVDFALSWSELTIREMIVCVVMVAICVIISIVRLKTGAVKEEDLLAVREAILHREMESEQQLEG